MLADFNKLTDHELDYDKNGNLIITEYASKELVYEKNKTKVEGLLKKIGFDSESINNIIDKMNISSEIKYKAGNELIERIINSEHVVDVIVIPNGASHTSDNFEDASTKGKGSGGIIFYDPIGGVTTKNVDTKNFMLIEENTPAYIVLAHELIHSDRAMRGETIPLDQYGEHICILIGEKLVFYHLFLCLKKR
jgi:hypothetical protein